MEAQRRRALLVIVAPGHKRVHEILARIHAISRVSPLRLSASAVNPSLQFGFVAIAVPLTRHCEPRQRRGNLLNLAFSLNHLIQAVEVTRNLKDCFALLAMTCQYKRVKTMNSRDSKSLRND